MSLCSLLYARLRENPPGDRRDAVEMASILLTLTTMQSVCLANRHAEHFHDVQQSIETTEWMCLGLLQTICASKSDFVLDFSFFITLARLRQTIENACFVHLESAPEGSRSLQSISTHIMMLMHGLFEQAPLDFADYEAVLKLDTLATFCGVESISPLLMKAFDNHNFKGTIGTKFLLRFFVLDLSRFPLPDHEPEPVYDGSDDSVRAICKWVMSNPAPHSSYTFPSSLSESDRRGIQMITQSVGQDRLNHYSTISGSSRALSVVKSGIYIRDKFHGDPLIGNALTLASRKKNAGVPSRWLQPVTTMIFKVYETVHNLVKASLSSAAEFASDILLLLSMQWLCSRDRPESRLVVLQKCASAADQLSFFVTLVFERECAEESFQSSMELTILPPLIHRIQALIQRTNIDPGSSEEQQAVDSLRVAFLPLTQCFSRFLSQQLATWSGSSNWTFPTAPARALFSLASFTPSWHPSRSNEIVGCTCEHCNDLMKFLQSSTENQIDFEKSQIDQNHLHKRVSSLNNPYLHVEGPGQKLRVTKTHTLHSLMQLKQKPFHELLKRVESVEAALMSSKQRLASLNSSPVLATSGAHIQSITPSNILQSSSPSTDTGPIIASQSGIAQTPDNSRGRNKRPRGVAEIESD